MIFKAAYAVESGFFNSLRQKDSQTCMDKKLLGNSLLYLSIILFIMTIAKSTAKAMSNRKAEQI